MSSQLPFPGGAAGWERAARRLRPSFGLLLCQNPGGAAQPNYEQRAPSTGRLGKGLEQRGEASDTGHGGDSVTRLEDFIYLLCII